MPLLINYESVKIAINGFLNPIWNSIELANMGKGELMQIKKLFNQQYMNRFVFSRLSWICSYKSIFLLNHVATWLHMQMMTANFDGWRKYVQLTTIKLYTLLYEKHTLRMTHTKKMNSATWFQLYIQVVLCWRKQLPFKRYCWKSPFL